MVVNVPGAPDEQAPFWRAAWKPLAVVAVVHLALIVGYSAFFRFNPSCFLNVGRDFQWADEKHFAPGTVKYTQFSGYDACDYYVVALDPLLLRDDVAPTYKIPEKFMRYQRFLYPLVIHMVACGDPRYFAHAMLFINFASMIGITLVLMKLLMRRGASPWLSLIFVLGGGMLLAFWLDLQMHFCFLIILLALYAYEDGRAALSASLFAAALLTWESTVLFAGPIGLWELLHRRWRNVICFLLVLVPFLAGQVYFGHKLGAKLLSGSPEALAFPFRGIAQSLLEILRLGREQGMVRLARGLLVTPVMALFLAMLGLAVWKLWQRRDNLYNLMLLLQLLFVVIQAKDIWLMFGNAMRINAGVFLPLLLSYRDQRDRVSPWLFAGAMGLAGLALLRIFLTVREPYILIGGG